MVVFCFVSVPHGANFNSRTPDRNFRCPHPCEIILGNLGKIKNELLHDLS